MRIILLFLDGVGIGAADPERNPFFAAPPPGIAALLESCNPSLTGPQKFALIVGHTDPYTDVRALGTTCRNSP